MINAISSTLERWLSCGVPQTAIQRGISGISSLPCSLGLKSIERTSTPDVLACLYRSEKKYIQRCLEEEVAAQLV